MNINVGDWGLYPWFLEHGEFLIHPEDLATFKLYSNNTNVYECVDKDEEYITIRLRDDHFRVKPIHFRKKSPPKFGFDADVYVKRNEQLVKSKVHALVWHYKRNKYIYILRFGTKISSKNYFEEDFISDLTF